MMYKHIWGKLKKFIEEAQEEDMNSLEKDDNGILIYNSATGKIEGMIDERYAILKEMKRLEKTIK